MTRGTVLTVLTLVGETELQIIGENVEGERRAFVKRAVRSYIVNRREESVTVRHLPGQLFKPSSAHKDQSPASQVRSHHERHCLSCGGLFKAQNDNRICDPCKSSWRWRNGAPEFGFGA